MMILVDGIKYNQKNINYSIYQSKIKNSNNNNFHPFSSEYRPIGYKKNMIFITPLKYENDDKKKIFLKKNYFYLNAFKNINDLDLNFEIFKNKNILIKFELNENNNNYNKLDLYSNLKEIFKDILFSVCENNENIFYIGGVLKEDLKSLLTFLNKNNIFETINNIDIYNYNSIEYMLYDILKWTKKNNISFINGFNFPYQKKYIKLIEKKFKDILNFKQNPDKYKKDINN
jgi:hypothetical protein